MNMTGTRGFVTGFVSILGRPNTGKSTLLNALVGTKLAIVAPKPQTTRTTIQGVLTLPEAQIVFLDTPGIHKADSALNRRMMRAARAALDGMDLLLYMADATAQLTAEDSHALDMLRKTGTPTFLLLNKMDRLKEKAQVLPLIEKYRELYPFEEYFPISALKREGLDDLRERMIARLPEGEAHFPADYITSQPERFLVSELIREKILHATRDEVPHSVAVSIERWEDTPRVTRIYATIYVEREGQKAIIIGSKGSMLKQVGTQARHETELLLDRKVFLELFVKVRPRWRENPEFLSEIGLV